MSKETKQYLLVIALPKVLFVLLVGVALSFRVSQYVLVLFGVLSLSAVILPIVDARSRSLVPALMAGLVIPFAAVVVDWTLSHSLAGGVVLGVACLSGEYGLSWFLLRRNVGV